MRIKKWKIILSFTQTGSGLISKNGELNVFAIAGADKKYVWANAKNNGNEIIVWNDAVIHLLNVRYAWADNP
jgi:sialate O-acetylesterase